MRRLLMVLLSLVAMACSNGSGPSLELRPLPKPPVSLDASPALAADGDAVVLVAQRSVVRLDAFAKGATWQRVIDDVPTPAGPVAGWQGRLWYVTAEGGGAQLVDVALSGDARLNRRPLTGVDPARYDLVAGLSALWVVSGASAWRVDGSGAVQPLLTAPAARLQAMGELPDATFVALAPDEQRVLLWTPSSGWAPASLDPQLFIAGARQTKSGLLLLGRDGVIGLTVGLKTESTRIETKKQCPVTDFFATDIGTVVTACDVAVRNGTKTTRLAMPTGEPLVVAGPRGRPLFVSGGSELLLLS